MNSRSYLALAALVLPMVAGLVAAGEDDSAGNCVTTTIVDASGVGLFWRADDTIVLGARTGAAGEGLLLIVEIVPNLCGPTGDLVGDITALPRSSSASAPQLPESPLAP